MSYNNGKKYKIFLTNQKIAETLYPLYIKDDARSAFTKAQVQQAKISWAEGQIYYSK